MSAGVTTLPFDFDIFLRSGSTMKPEMPAFVHGTLAVLELGAQHGREQPGADDVLALAGAGRTGTRGPNSSGSRCPAARELRGERRGRPGVHDVELALEAARTAALRPRCSRAAHPTTGRRAATPRSARSTRRTALAVLVELVPDRDRHAEEALARDEPVAGEAADPVLVAHAHEVGVRRRSRVPRVEEPLAQLLVARAVARCTTGASRRSRAAGRPSRRTSRRA